MLNVHVFSTSLYSPMICRTSESYVLCFAHPYSAVTKLCENGDDLIQANRWQERREYAKLQISKLIHR